MDTSERILVIILSTTLAILLVLLIVIAIKVIQIMNRVKHITEKAESIADKAEAVSDFFRSTSGPAAIAKLLSNVVASFRDKTAKGSRRNGKR